jgi:hypothetical protein
MHCVHVADVIAHVLVKDLEPSTPQEYILKVTRPLAYMSAEPHTCGMMLTSRMAWYCSKSDFALSVSKVRGELGEAHALVKDLEPSTPQEYILKVTRSLG